MIEVDRRGLLRRRKCVFLPGPCRPSVDHLVPLRRAQVLGSAFGDVLAL